MPVTQKDIAEKVGISRPMVALALAGHPKISEHTRLRVEEAAREMGYNPHINHGARALISRRHGKRVRTGILALLLPESHLSLRNSAFFGPLVLGVEAGAQENGMEICYLVYRHENPLPRLLVNGSVDGAISLSWSEKPVHQLAEYDVPLVGLTQWLEGVPHLLPDERRGFRLATEHLLQLGHQNIAFLAPAPESRATQERLAGFREAMEAAKISDKALVMVSNRDHNHAPEQVQELLRNQPQVTALVCYNDYMAMEAVRELERQGRRVPEQMSVVGFDDTSHQQGFKPALSSVAYDRFEMGRAAACTLKRCIDGEIESGEGLGSAAEMLFDVEVVPRNSTCPPR